MTNEEKRIWYGYGSMIGYGGGWSVCNHTDLTEEEFTTVCVELFGGSFSELYKRLVKRGFKVVKS